MSVRASMNLLIVWLVIAIALTVLVAVSEVANDRHTARTASAYITGN